MDENTKVDQQGNFPVDSSINDQPTDFMELIRERAFLGDTPFDSICEGIRKQFENYINMEDQTNYVDIFYQQLALSYDVVNNDESEEHPNEIRDVLDSFYQAFMDIMQSLFSTRLTITIPDLEAESIDREDLEFIIRRLYEFFILGAKNNFKVVIATDINPKLKDIGDDDNEYFRRLNELMENYSPLILTITPMDFIRYRGDQEIYDLFDNNRVVGNFLRKYSPKLYQNEDFRVELINYITMVAHFKQDIIDNKTLDGEN